MFHWKIRNDDEFHLKDHVGYILRRYGITNFGLNHKHFIQENLLK